MKKNECCLLCGAGVSRVLSLTPTPIANNLEEPGSSPSGATYPLDLHLCGGCGHLQLGVAVDPELLFRNYTYVSPPGMREHWAQHAGHCIPRFSLREGDPVVEAGSNNGDLLREYRDRGMRVLGFEPAAEIATISRCRSIATEPEFFTLQNALRVAARYGLAGKAKMVLANNVFAHMLDLRDFMRAVDVFLAPDGVFIFEVHDRRTLVEQGDWPSIYHEHVHYWALAPALSFFDSLGMHVFDVQSIPTHNGSLRIFVQRKGGARKRTEAIALFVAREEEDGLFDSATYAALHERIERTRYEFQQLFDALIWGPINAGGVAPKVAVLGCPAKLTTMAYHFGLKASDVAYVVDDAPTKIGKLTPGLRWPIQSFDALADDPPGIAVVGAFNYAVALIDRTKRLYAERGRALPVFLNPYPAPHVVK